MTTTATQLYVWILVPGRPAIEIRERRTEAR